MADKKFNLDFYAKVQTDVGSVKEVVKNLKAQLENLKLPAGATKSFEKSFERLEGQIRDFESLASSGINSLADTKKVQAAWDKIAKSFSSLGFSLKELDTISDQIFPKEVNENIKKANRALEEYQNKLKEIKDTEKYKAKKAQISEAEKEVTRTRTNYSNEQKKLANKRDEVAGLEKAWAPRAEEYEKQAEKVRKLNEEYQNLSNTLDRMRADKATLETIGAIDSTGKVSSKYKNLLSEREGELADLEDEAKLKEKNQEKQLEFEERIRKAQDKLRKATQYEKQSKTEEKKAKWIKEQAEAQAELNAAQNDSKNFAAAIEARKEALREEIKIMKEHIALAEQVTQTQINEQSKKAAEKGKELRQEEENEAFKDDKKLKKNLEAASAQLRTLEATSQSAKDALDTAEKAVEGLNNELNNIEIDDAKKEWQEVVNTLKQFTDVNLDETKGDIEAVKKILEDYTINEIKETPEILERLRQAASGAEKPIRDVGKAADDTAEEFREMDRAARDMENLKDQVLDFFSISNAIQIFKDAIRSAFETVKELDAAMTETAVVTDFSVGDMWEKLPQYADEASKLGTSIKSLYEATTLYYQQGLNSAQAMDVGVETMKMARIAGMDAAAATEAMTAALRGFNMEINEMSATRINDVYSELAAITAADTSQIATAMSKTASIAASANMEFETTAALLAQIIETTQEAPETAGTAMKTIIARFTEVKQLFDEGMLTGKDSEGEEIDINKIDAALKKVGISLSDFLRGEKGIDDIFLELASKWDTLDLATQRYIATTAAGSRQQSRFLAMMGNYGRTMELVTAANNSAGASQKQFDKTLESLDAKLQRLKNAWDTFTMGLANNELIKLGVDLLTKLLETINDLTDDLGGAVGGFAKLAIAIGGLKVGKSVFNNIFDIKQVESSFGKVNSITDILGKKLKKLGSADAKNASEGLDEVSSKAAGVSIAFAATGAACGLLAQYFRSLGLEELATGLEMVGSSLMILSSGISALDAIAKAAGTSIIGLFGILKGAISSAATAIGGFLAALGWWIVPIVAGIAAIVAGFISIYKNSPTGQLKAAEKAAADAADAAQKAADAYNNLNSALDGISSRTASLDNMTRGTQEWRDAVTELNKEMLSLVEQYPELAGYLTNEGGVLKIDYDKKIANKYGEEQTAQEVVNSYQQRSIDTQQRSYQKQIEEKEAEINLKFDKEILNNATGNWYYTSPESERYGKSASYYENHEKEIFDNLALAIADGEISNNFSEVQEWFKNNSDLQLYNYEDFDYYALQEYGNYLISSQAAIEGLTDAAIAAQMAMTDFSGVSTEAQQMALNLNSDILRASYEKTKAENEKKESEITEADRDAYARAMGYTKTKNWLGNTKYEDSEGTKVKIDDADVSKFLATTEADKDVEDTLTTLAKHFDASSEDQQKLMGEIFTDGAKDLSFATLAKFGEYQNGEFGFTKREDKRDELAIAMGFDEFSTMIDELNIGIDELEKTLNNKFKEANEKTKKQRLSTANSIAEYSAGSGLTRDEIYASVAEAEKQMQGELTDIEVRGILDSAIQALSSTGDSQLAQTGIFKLLNEGIEGNAEKFKALSDVITGINWNDPVEASSQIQKHLNSSNATAREFAQEMMALNSTFLGDASQLQAFFNSSEYEDIASKIAEIREVQDKVTGADVEKLASEYSYLNKMLKNTKMTSEGLAAILNQVSEGALGFEEINDVILAGIKNLGSFGASLDKILAYLNDFDPGRDEGQAQDFIDQASEVVNERVANFEYGNTEARNYITELLGKDYLQGDAQQQMAAMDTAAKWLQEISGSPGAAMQVFKNIAEGKDIMGNTIAGGQQKPEGINFGYGADGKFFMHIDAQKYGTLEEATAAFAETNLGGTKTLWDTMFTLLSNYDPAFMQEWEMEQAALAPQRMREEALKVDDKAIISQKSIDTTAKAMYDALGDSTGKSLEKFKEEIVDELNELGGYEIFDVFNDDGTRKKLEQLKKDIEGLFGGGEKGQAGLLSNYLIGKDGEQLIDFTSLTKGLETFGLTTQEAFSAALDYVSELPAQLESVKSIMVNGQEISLVNADGTKKDLEVIKEEITNVKTAAEEGNTEMQVNTAAATQKIRSYRDEITSVPKKWNTQFTTSGTTTPPTSNSIVKPNGMRPTTTPGPQMMIAAEGTENHPRSELSLTGEEGPELVYGKNGAYIVGLEGPQMAQINRGDTVFTAEETEEIYRRKGVSINNYAPGKDGITTGILDLDKIISGGSGGRSGGSSKDDEEEIWENPFDKLYNLLRKIDEELHQRERIERRYEKLLEGIDASAAKIVAVSREELAHLEQERKLQEWKISGRNYQIDEYQKENSDLLKYARFVENDRGERVLRIDWDLIDRVTDTEKGERIEEYVSQLEEWDDDIQEAEEALWEIEDTVAEIKERGKDQYEELEETIKDAVTQAYQDQIDKLSQINESINDTNTELLDAIQNSIDKQRQDRDNERTEDEIAKKQRRLLYLQQDTSGANALEILKLQDEIAQDQEDYTDTLIDQKISELQRQNDEAAKQREKQITLLQAQLDHYIESGIIWDEVYSLMENGLDENNGLIRGSRLETILKNSENFSGLSAIGQQEWWKEMNTMIAEALAYLELGRQLEDIGVKNQEIEMVLPDGSTVKGIVDNQGNVTTADGQVYNNVYQGADGRYYAAENIEESKNPVVEHPNDGDSNSGNVEPEVPKTNTIKKNIKNTPKGYNVRSGASLKASKIGALSRGTEIEIDGYKADWYHIINPLKGFIHQGAITSNIDRTKLKAYKTGGLADFTGPAWLDGTKSRPEIVLNQQDSRNFIQLRDILSTVLSRGNVNTSTENNGDILYDIDINVESISNDYDVEQVANKVKSLINEDARYRNNNVVSLKR